MKVTITPIVIGALRTVTKGLLKGLNDLEFGGPVETIQTTALLRTPRIMSKVLETWGDFVFIQNPVNADVKNSKGESNNNNNKTVPKLGKGTGKVGNLMENETIPNTVWLRSVRILKRVLEIWGDLLSL